MNPPLHPETLTWAGLLARWVEFAQASLALPKDAVGEAWRASVPHIINLQAVTFALADMDALAGSERAVAFDKAEVLTDRSAAALRQMWSDGALPEMVAEIIADCRAALAAASSAQRRRGT